MQEAAAERRAHIRIEFDAPVSISSESSSYQSSVHDISLKGLLIHTPSDWALPMHASCTVALGLMVQEPIIMQTIVRRIDQQFIGLECEAIDVESISRLRRLVELNLGDESLLERELEALVEHSA